MKVYKKRLIILLVVTFFLTGCVGVQSNQNSIAQETQKDGERANNVKEIIVTLDPEGGYWTEAKPITITQEKMIEDILTMIDQGTSVEDTSKFDNMSGMVSKNNQLTIIQQDGSKQKIKFSYDSVYEVGYIELEDKKVEPDYSFFRYMEDLLEYSKADASIEKQIVELFEKYNWTIDYKINTLQEKLPENLKHKAGEYPIKVYWAYNNELSKDIGLDFTHYLGKDILVEIYRLRESLPEFMEPRRNARGIVLKDGDKIIGAYIDAGRHDSFACSLDRKSLKDVTGKEWGEWVEDYIDNKDALEVKLSQMSPEDIIKGYFKAIDSQDIKAARAYLSRRHLIQYLSSNLNNEISYNKEPDSLENNIKSAKLLELKKLEGIQNKTDKIEYQVEVDFDFKEFITEEDGIGTRFIILKKETEKSGWRIESIGTGP